MDGVRITEAEWMAQVTQLAEMMGYSWVHFRPARTVKGWRTPVSGPMGKGWPDLVLVKGQRILFVELKRDGVPLEVEQRAVLEMLDEVGEAYCWRPRDFDAVAALLGATEGRT